MFDSWAHRIAAAIVALAYIAIQSFQWFVFSQLPVADGPAQVLLQGPLPLNLARAVLMLLSFFGLAWLFLVCCTIAFRRRPLLAMAAFLGLFVFCLLEVQLRSVELFYVYLELPERYQAAAALEQAHILDLQSTFQSLQHALYFPLGLSWLLGSVALCMALGGHRFDWLAQFAFGLNALRLLLRMLDVYVFGGPQFDALYSTLYLPLVYLTFVPIVAWLLLRRDDTGPNGK